MHEFVLGKNPCPKCRSDGGDKSGDNFHWYGVDDGGFCYSCGFTIMGENRKNELGLNKWNYEEDESVGLEFNEKVLSEIKEEYEFIDQAYRGIRPETYKYFGVMHKVNENGELEEQIYPTFRGKDVCGFKRRKLPKKFLTPYGDTGADVDFFGQFRFLKSTSRDVLIVGGEIDAMSAFQILKDFRDRSNKVKGTDFPHTAVVSSTIGELGAATQCKHQYEWLNRFDKIIVCMDNDTAGKEACDKLFSSIPKGKMYVMDLGLKDPNEYVKQGKESEFVDLYFKAKPHTPAGVYASSTLYDAAVSYTSLDKLTFPPFLKDMEDMFGGGWVKKEICVLFASTSVGKSSFVNEMTIHWAMKHNEEVIGVLSLEATVDKYATSLISSYLGVKLISMDNPDDKKAYLEQDAVKSKVNELLVKEDGTPRFYVCDDRGAEISVVKEKILEMIIKVGITTLVIDPYSDLQSGMSVADQEDFSTWMKKIVKEYNITLVLVCHTKKGAGQNDEPLTESDIIGSSTIMKSSAQTISLERNKLHDNPIMRNVTTVTVHKNRHFGTTGVAGKIYYDWKTGQLHPFEQWKSDNPEAFADF